MVGKKDRLLDENGKSFLLTHNIKGNTVEYWEKQFKANEQLRQIKRKDSIKLYHEMISFHKDDVKNVSVEKLENVAREYIQLRNPNGMYVAIPNFDKENYHIHVCSSGVEYKTGKAMRLSKKDLATLKQKIQQYQIEKYPELTNSVVAHGKSKGRALTDKEYQYKLRTGQETNKERVIDLLNTCYAQADSKEDFFKRLKDHELTAYIRSGKVTGVIHKNIKHRFKKFGFIERLDALDKTRERMKDLKQIREKQQIQKTRNRGINR
jgi:hypothetical protein